MPLELLTSDRSLVLKEELTGLVLMYLIFILIHPFFIKNYAEVKLLRIHHNFFSVFPSLFFYNLFSCLIGIARTSSLISKTIDNSRYLCCKSQVLP